MPGWEEGEWRDETPQCWGKIAKRNAVWRWIHFMRRRQSEDSVAF